MHLNEFKLAIKFEGNVKFGIAKLNKKKFENCKVTITSEQIIKDLARMNIFNNKSLTLKPPDLDWTLIQKCAFLKGYIDGDGCIYLGKHTRVTYQLSLVGTFSFLQWVKEIFEEILNYNFKNKIRKSKKNSNSHQFCIHGQKAEIVLDYLHNIKTPELKRKWNKLYEFRKIKNGLS